MVDALKEFEAVIGRSVGPAMISTISEPEGPMTGLVVKIDHGDSEVGDNDMGDLAEVFPMYATFSAPQKNWADAMRAARAVKQNVLSSKHQRWSVGPINRIDAEGTYSIRLTVLVTLVYRP